MEENRYMAKMRVHELAKELGYDAGFGPVKFADDVASYVVNEMVERGIK